MSNVIFVVALLGMTNVMWHISTKRGFMKTNGNDTAYPSAGVQNFEETNQVGGLTKREHFAAMAMQGFCANEGLANLIKRFPEKDEICVARAAVEYADALIEELNKTKDE